MDAKEKRVDEVVAAVREAGRRAYFTTGDSDFEISISPYPRAASVRLGDGEGSVSYGKFVQTFSVGATPEETAVRVREATKALEETVKAAVEAEAAARRVPVVKGSSNDPDHWSYSYYGPGNKGHWTGD